jgi:hypothetical protein
LSVKIFYRTKAKSRSSCPPRLRYFLDGHRRSRLYRGIILPLTISLIKYSLEKTCARSALRTRLTARANRRKQEPGEIMADRATDAPKDPAQLVEEQKTKPLSRVQARLLRPGLLPPRTIRRKPKAKGKA